jgi:hypothetical protein
MHIRHLATSFSGSRFAAAEFEHTVHIWDLRTATRQATFNTVLSFGGRRLAITCDGNRCAAAAYHVRGVEAYSTSEGAVLWRRTDLKKVQSVSVSIDDRRIYCCFDEKPCHVLSCDTGRTIRSWRGVRSVWESPYEELMLLVKRAFVVQSHDEREISRFERESFGVLSVAFALGFVCVSEAGGPLRCLSTSSGYEVWRFSERGKHFLNLAFSETANAFVGVLWPYERGGRHQLFRFERETGAVLDVSELPQAAEFAFCQRGSRLITSDGSLINVATGGLEYVLPFGPGGLNGN